MHAASVHPEPGSNSLWVVINRSLSRPLILFRSSYSWVKKKLTSSIYIFEPPCGSGDTHVVLLCFVLFSVVQFSMSVSLSCPLGDSFAMITHLFPFVKRFFELFSSFFNFFALTSYSMLRVTTARSQLAYLTTFLSFCQLLFSFFFTFGGTVQHSQNKSAVFIQK